MSKGVGAFLFRCADGEDAFSEPDVKGVCGGAHDVIPTHLLIGRDCEVCLTANHRAKFERLFLSIEVHGNARRVINAREKHC